MQSHLHALEKKKMFLDKKIEERQSAAWHDDVSVRTLKRQKLYLSDELERLRRASH